MCLPHISQSFCIKTILYTEKAPYTPYPPAFHIHPTHFKVILLFVLRFIEPKYFRMIALKYVYIGTLPSREVKAIPGKVNKNKAPEKVLPLHVSLMILTL